MSKISYAYAPGVPQLAVLPPPLGLESAPTSQQSNFSVGQIAYTPIHGGATTTFYIYSGDGIWDEFVGSGFGVSSVTGTTNQVTATPTTGAVALTIPATFTSPGSVTAAAGNITATNGNLVLTAAGNKLVIHATTPTSDSVGTTGAMTTGAVTITSTAITATSKIIYSRRTVGGTAGNVAISAQAAGSATLTSDSGTETSTFDYLIIN